MPATAPDELLGPGPSACRIRELIRRAAVAPYPVLIEGAIGPQPHPNFIEVVRHATLDHRDWTLA